MEIREVRHLLTYNCVLRCSHCYLSAGEHPEVRTNIFTEEQADEFYGSIRPESVSATGGEPLVYPDLVRILARSTAKIGCALELVTSGLLLKKGLIKELNNLNDKTFYQISLDGTEEFHDHLRGKKGAYRKAMNAIKLCSESGRITKARMSVMPGNYNQIPEVIKTLDSFQRDNIQLVLRAALDAGRAHTNKLSFGSDYVQKLRQFIPLAKSIKVSVTDRCGYCLDSLTIDPKGDIYPCCYFVFNPEYKMGHMSDPKNLQTQPDFVNYTGKCFAVEKFSSLTPTTSKCKSCTTHELLKPGKR